MRSPTSACRLAILILVSIAAQASSAQGSRARNPLSLRIELDSSAGGDSSALAEAIRLAVAQDSSVLLIERPARRNEASSPTPLMLIVRLRSLGDAKRMHVRVVDVATGDILLRDSSTATRETLSSVASEMVRRVLRAIPKARVGRFSGESSRIARRDGGNRPLPWLFVLALTERFSSP